MGSVNLQYFQHSHQAWFQQKASRGQQINVIVGWTAPSISSMECFAVAAGMPRRFQAFPRPDPASEQAMTEFGFKCFQKCGKNSSAVSPAPGPPFLKGVDFRGLTTTFLLSRLLISFDHKDSSKRSR